MKGPYTIRLYAGERWRVLKLSKTGNWAWIERGPVNDPLGQWVHIRLLREP